MTSFYLILFLPVIFYLFLIIDFLCAIFISNPTSPPPTASVDEVFCDFGPLPVQSLCEWQDGNGALRWTTGTGLSTNWLGGPPIDSTAGSMEGG